MHGASGMDGGAGRCRAHVVGTGDFGLSKPQAAWRAAGDIFGRRLRHDDLKERLDRNNRRDQERQPPARAPRTPPHDRDGERDHTRDLGLPEDRDDRREQIEKLWLARPRTAIAVTIILCLLAAIHARKVTFDYNLLNMQSAGLPAVIFQDKLIKSSSKSVLFGAIMVDSLDQAITLKKKIMAARTT